MPQIKGKQIADAQITQAKLDLVDPTSALEAATKQYVDNLADGKIDGTIAAGEVAFGTGVDSIGGDSRLTWNTGTGELSVTDTATVNSVKVRAETFPLIESNDSMNINVANFSGALGLQAGGNDLVLVGGDDGTGESYLQSQNGVRIESRGRLVVTDYDGSHTATLVAQNNSAVSSPLNLSLSALQINGSAGSSGQFLKSLGGSSAPIWDSVPTVLSGTALRSYYVAKGGNDGTADGSVGKPFLTIQAAHDKALTDYPLSGATTAPIEIILCPGTYTENITITRQRTHFFAQSINPETKSVTIVGNVTVQCNSATQYANDPVSFKGILFAPNNASTSPAVLVSGTGAFSIVADGCYFYTTSTNVAAHAISCTNTSASRTRILLTNCSVQAVNAGPNAIDAQRGAWQIYNCRISYSASSGAGRPMYIANDATMYGGLSVVDSSNTISTVYAIGTMPAGSTTKVNLGYTAFVNSSASGTGHGIQLATAGLVSLTASSFFSITNTAGTVYAIAGVAGSVACATGSLYASNATWQGTVTRSDISSDFAGGDLTGRYPSPTIASGAVTDAKVSATANIAQSKISGLTTALANKVTKTGDLMTGTLEFQTSGDSIKASNNSGQQYFSLNASTTELKMLNTAGGSASTAIDYNSVVVDDAAGAVTSISPSAITLEVSGGLPPTPTLDTHVVTKKYVDDLVNGVSWKAPAKLVSTSAIATLSGTTATIDGQSISAEDRVLLSAQADSTDNGLWVVKAGAWQRPADFADGESAMNAAVFIEIGDNYADTAWICSAGDVIGTDGLTFVQFGAGATYTAGSGLQLIGGAFSVKLDGDSIYVSGSGTKAATLSSSGQEQAPSATTGNYATTGLTLGSTPSGNGVCHVFVNGIRVSVGSGVRTKDAYFSNDGGTTAVTYADLASGDTLYWNGTIAGYDLEATDSVSFLYQDIV